MVLSWIAGTYTFLTTGEEGHSKFILNWDTLHCSNTYTYII